MTAADSGLKHPKRQIEGGGIELILQRRSVALYSSLFHHIGSITKEKIS